MLVLLGTASAIVCKLGSFVNGVGTAVETSCDRFSTVAQCKKYVILDKSFYNN